MTNWFQSHMMPGAPDTVTENLDGHKIMDKKFTLDRNVHSHNHVCWVQSRPNTSQRQRKRLPPCHKVIALVPLKCPVEIYNFPIGCPLPRRNPPWCPCPFKNVAHRPTCLLQFVTKTPNEQQI